MKWGINGHHCLKFCLLFIQLCAIYLLVFLSRLRKRLPILPLEPENAKSMEFN